jgi:hypothetical protein
MKSGSQGLSFHSLDEDSESAHSAPALTIANQTEPPRHQGTKRAQSKGFGELPYDFFVPWCLGGERS